jgi:hypothetical protein
MTIIFLITLPAFIEKIDFCVENRRFAGKKLGTKHETASFLDLSPLDYYAIR